MQTGKMAFYLHLLIFLEFIFSPNLLLFQLLDIRDNHSQQHSK